ncbi:MULTISPECIES: LytTR family transcriptional regulator DNA-binding domain-containing protein [unclassified Imperialibacter]|uniref:LytTR family transcriptional regulator DNA-binding domain-containing protein n=1 Tax=unclassified Imperialibacter TaxID=2629706 RepID=UPI001251E497|nr:MULTISPECIES: LytTR family transcriptional regulator DNA-binding domain-containing protein [unclassified Imperialibacter]CAD5254872.1 putative LytTR family transcriptional regulator [Imperialibacter sp. 89]CAD5256227.1 putative LytTR family transcriptional regulator [Imperialibacter sp. 75]VVT20466.1 putative Two component transcriptional regulator, LytTR family [Imperialibacter sp. EC-SDR9]
MVHNCLPPFKRDIWVILGVSFVVSQVFLSIGADLSWFELLYQTNFLPDTIYSFSLTSLLWLFVRQVTKQLQKKHDWFDRPLSRILLQTILGLALPSLVCVTITSIYFHLYYKVPISATSFPDYELPFSIIVIGQFNVYYIIYYFYRASKVARHDDGRKTGSLKSVIGTFGRKNVPVEAGNIANIFIRGAVVYITTFEGSRLSINYTLDEVFGLLSEEDFFRANRQVIVHRKSCRSFVSEPNGKLLLEVHPSMDEPVVISQLKATDFKKWISHS